MVRRFVNSLVFLLVIQLYQVLSDDFIGPAGLAVSEANGMFTSDLYHKTKNVFPAESNFIISPFSLGSVLTMLRAGAGINSSTEDEIHKVLGFQGLNESAVYDGYSDIIYSLHENAATTVNSATRIYITNSANIKPQFKKTLQEKFFTEVVPTNFIRNSEVAEDINRWVKKSTNGKITNVISAGSIPQSTQAIVANALYFKGKWKESFEPRSTTLKYFHSDATTKKLAMFMEQETDFPFIQLPEISASAISMPYQGDRFSLVVILPNDGISLSDVEEKISGLVSLTDIPWKMSMKFIRLTFPKFQMESETNYVKSEILKKLGLKSMINPGEADFSRITSKQNIYIDAVIQKCYIDITEWGTEAAGATYAQLVPLSFRKSTPFTVTKPFVAYIFDKVTKTVLFIFRKTSV